MAFDSCSAGTDSPVLSCVFSVRNRLKVRFVASGETQNAMSRLLCRFGHSAAGSLVGALILALSPVWASAQPRDRVVAELLNSQSQLEAELGRVPSHPMLTGTLSAGESESVQVHTCSGMEYKAIGVCDLDCSDVDLTAYNATGEIMDLDVLRDDVPIVRFTPPACGFTRLSVDMVECDGSCEWAVQLYIDDPTPPSGSLGSAGGLP